MGVICGVRGGECVKGMRGGIANNSGALNEDGCVLLQLLKRDKHVRIPE